MKTFSAVPDMRSEVRTQKARGKTVGLVPTMGYLHEGHLSLIRGSIRQMDYTVASVFVNPAQFAPNEDLQQYPRDMKRDSDLLEKEGVNSLFAPGDDQMYPQGFGTYVEVVDMQHKLCGRSRPAHFRGVCTVVLKLFNIIEPDAAFFGQKDAQQAIIIRKMVRDLNLDVKIEVMPIVRDEQGLALSSRNAYLSPELKKQALSLSASLKEAQNMIESGERTAEKIIRRMKKIIGSEPSARIDYVEVVDTDNLDPLKKIDDQALIAVAVFFEKVRLIDNFMFESKEKKQ